MKNYLKPVVFLLLLWPIYIISYQIFFNELEINNLEIYFDKNVNLAKKFLLRGLPTTVLVNKNGEEFGRIVGLINFDDKNILKWLKQYD